MSSDDAVLTFDIRPEPSDEEAGVIVAALTALSATSQSAPVEETPCTTRRSKWTLAGRRQALHASPHARRHWSRDLAWLEKTAR
jgi:hypothetical protein